MADPNDDDVLYGIEMKQSELNEGRAGQPQRKQILKDIVW